MLFNFSPTSLGLNWLQRFLSALVVEALSAKIEKRTAREWQQIMPPEHVSALKGRYGLRSRYKTLVGAARLLTIAQAQGWLNHVSSASYYGDVLSGATVYRPPAGSKPKFDAALSSLFDFAFDLLGQLAESATSQSSIRDVLYSHAYHAMPAHLCPFCGIDHFDAPHPNMPRHALDHYLASSLYPAFGAHLPNLVPMCSRCNSSFKLAKDMLMDDSGNARSCIDPYGNVAAKVSLMKSAPFGGSNNGGLPQWVIDFDPPSQGFETWASVFGIRLRYKESLLDGEYRTWLEAFAAWAKDGQIEVANNQSVSVALTRWASIVDGLNDQGFLKKPMFEMLAASALRQDIEGNRLTQIVIDLCTM